MHQNIDASQNKKADAIPLEDVSVRTTSHGAIERHEGSASQAIQRAGSEEGNLESVISETNSEEEEATFPDGGWRAYSIILGSFLGLTCHFGVINAIGAIQAYISAHQLAGLETTTVSWIFSIYVWLALFLGVIIGPVFDNQGCRKLLIAGAAFSFLGFMCISVSKTVYQFVLSLSICIGVSHSLCITPLIGILSHWFYLKRGQALGIASMGGSIGGAVIPLMLRSLYPKVGFEWAIRALGFLCLGCMIISIMLSKERFRSPFFDVTEPSKKKRLQQTTKKLFDVAALKEFKYTLMVAGTFTSELSLVMTTTYFASYAMAQGMEESKSYLLLTIFNLSGIVGRTLPATLSDYIGHFNVMICMLFGFELTILLIWLPFGANHQALFAFAALAGFFSSSIFSLTPACLASVTPVHSFGQRYGLLYSIVSFGNLFGLPVGAAVIGDGSPHNYQMFTVVCGVLTALGTFFWAYSRYQIVGFKINSKI